MSGLEIVGAVFAGLPLLIGGAKALKESLDNTFVGFMFSSKLSDMVFDIEQQANILEQHLRRLLSLVNLRSRFTDHIQREDLTFVEWGSAELQRDLEDCIGPKSFASIRANILEQEFIIKILRPMVDSAQIKTAGFKDRMSMARRFIEHKDDLDALKRTNDAIDYFLKREEDMANSSILVASFLDKRTSKTDFKACKALLSLQEHVRNLHQIFQPQSWSNTCFHEHPCGIIVLCDNSLRHQEGSVELLLGPINNRKRVRVEIQHRETASANQTNEMDLSLLELAEPPTKRVRFNAEIPQDRGHRTSPPRRKSRAVSCDLFCRPETSIAAPFGTSGESMAIMELNPPSQRNTDQNIFSLETFYKSVGRLDRRLRLGLKIAYSILGLGTTPWFPQGWDSRDISVLYDVTAVPFYLHHCIRKALSRVVNAKAHAEMAVFSLGVIFLQLLFQQKLDEQPFWVNYLVNGREDERTLELAALKWHEAVEDCYPGDIADAIYRCLSGKFLAKADLNKKDFVYEVLTTVIRPLEEFTSRLDWMSKGKGLSTDL